ncbi:Bicyclomycin resistance protein, putative, partial [Tolypocladium paradoxum]
AARRGPRRHRCGSQQLEPGLGEADAGPVEEELGLRRNPQDPVPERLRRVRRARRRWRGRRRGAAGKGPVRGRLGGRRQRSAMPAELQQGEEMADCGHCLDGQPMRHLRQLHLHGHVRADGGRVPQLAHRLGAGPVDVCAGHQLRPHGPQPAERVLRPPAHLPGGLDDLPRLAGAAGRRRQRRRGARLPLPRRLQRQRLSRRLGRHRRRPLLQERAAGPHGALLRDALRRPQPGPAARRLHQLQRRLALDVLCAHHLVVCPLGRHCLSRPRDVPPHIAEEQGAQASQGDWGRPMDRREREGQEVGGPRHRPLAAPALSAAHLRAHVPQPLPLLGAAARHPVSLLRRVPARLWLEPRLQPMADGPGVPGHHGVHAAGSGDGPRVAPRPQQPHSPVRARDRSQGRERARVSAPARHPWLCSGPCRAVHVWLVDVSVGALDRAHHWVGHIWNRERAALYRHLYLSCGCISAVRRKRARRQRIRALSLCRGVPAVWESDVREAGLPMGVVAAGLAHRRHAAVPIHILQIREADPGQEPVCHRLAASQDNSIQAQVEKTRLDEQRRLGVEHGRQPSAASVGPRSDYKYGLRIHGMIQPLLGLRIGQTRIRGSTYVITQGPVLALR